MKKRVIPIILINEGGNVVISRQFSPWRTVGFLTQSVRLHTNRGADELIILDISARRQGRLISERLLEIIASNSNIPVTIGGGISTLDDARYYIRNGADKVTINYVDESVDGLIEKISRSLGAQAVSVNINLLISNGQIKIFDYSKRCGSKLESLEALFKKFISFRVGELIITSVIDDGSMDGFNLQLMKTISKINVILPTIITGGAGLEKHFFDAMKNYGLSAAGGSIFNLTEHTPLTIRKYCKKLGIDTRSEYE